MDLPVDFAHILSDMGTYMWHAGLVPDGSKALETAEHILDERGVDEIDPLRGDILGNLGMLSGFAGVSQRKEGMERRLEALKIRKEVNDDIPEKKITQDDRTRLYIAESDLAFGHLQEEDFEKVEEILWNVACPSTRPGILKTTFPTNMPNTITMSLVRASQGSIRESLDFSRRGVGLVTKSAGEEHSVIQLWKFSLANLLFHSGDIAESLRVNEEVLSVRRRTCGEFNAFSLESYSTCGALLLREGKAERAA